MPSNLELRATGGSCKLAFLKDKKGLISIWELGREDIDSILDGAAELQRNPRPQGMNGARDGLSFF